MQRCATIASILIALLVLSACEETKRALGQTKEAPDEFAVYRRPPLSLPPDYNLRPPNSGNQRPQVMSQSNRAREALGIAGKLSDSSKLINSQDLVNLSRGERAVLSLTGANQANSEIRQLVKKESLALFEEGKSFTDKLVFWQTQEKFGTTVDPEKEQKRIREAQALGKPLHSKDIPTISRKKRAVFEGVFN